jgi:diguanylate cyclase (GGDEF)-like protein/PAS domain S-box-containing protein
MHNNFSIRGLLLHPIATVRRIKRERRELLKQMRRLQDSEAFLYNLIQSIPDLIWLKDAEGIYLACNPAFERFFGATQENIIGKTDYEFVDRDLADSFRHHDKAAMSSGRATVNEEWITFVLGNHRALVETTKVPMFTDSGELLGVLGIARDITERKRLEAELLEMATTDFLTGLSNRRHFMTRMQDELARVNRRDTLQVAVLMLDIDHFKRINDRHGHAAGDAVLKQFAVIIGAELRIVDSVGRVGGEEFAILLSGTDRGGAHTFAERLREKIARALFQQDGEKIPVTVSIGITVMNTQDASINEVLQRADAALYTAKESGRNRVEIAAER